MSKTAKKSARERLLAFVGADGSQYYMGYDAIKHSRTVRRLLREHERELAERAVVAVDALAGRGDVPLRVVSATIRAAILKRSDAPKAHGTRGKRGAK